jgi:hypothetical protein
VPKTFKDKIYYETDLNLGYGTFQRWKTGLSFIPSVTLSEHFSAGAGLKYSFIPSRWRELNMSFYNDLGIEVRGYAYLKNTINTPYARITGGYTFSLPKNERNTKPLFYSIGIGQKLKLKKSTILLTASYEYHKSRFTYRQGWGLYSDDIKSDWYRNHSINGSIALRF